MINIDDMPYFIFNDVDSRDYLTVNKLPSLYKPEKDINKIEIPGRDGFLTEDLGSYRSYNKTVECTIHNTEYIDYICSWLDGSSDVIFSNEPDKIYKATISNKIEFSKILYTYKSFIVVFECQPYKFAINNPTLSITSSLTIHNFTNCSAKPLIKIYGDGDVSLSINSKVVQLYDIDSYVTINSEIEDCYKDTLLKNNYMSGDFPMLVVGANAITWEGSVTKIELTPNWRYR